MAGFNRVILIGNLTRDPEYRQLASGQAVCRLGLATNRQFKNRQTGSLVQEVCYIDIDVWGAQAESCRQYLSKGRSVLIEGRLKFDTWEDQTGQKRNKHSIVADRVVFLSSSAEMDVQDNEIVNKSWDNQTGSGLQLDPTNETERELLEQLEKAKTKVQAAKSEKKKNNKESQDIDNKNNDGSGMGEIDFKDEPPFADDLPF
ncbi:MAG: single-stranded DNA-binding protein [Candidatus Babeliales bacterium]